MLKAQGTVWDATGNTRSQMIYISADLTKDSQYPFKHKEKVNVEFDPKKQMLIITKRKPGEK